ncbi:hypothetical protein CS296_29685 [Pseudomonas syringae pv. actinidiae]|nr:hypothetical protein CS296_29685 [Pseudomonas syringae pv. actinidiae]
MVVRGTGWVLAAPRGDIVLILWLPVMFSLPLSLSRQDSKPFKQQIADQIASLIRAGRLQE